MFRQETMSISMSDSEFVHIYIDNLVVTIARESFKCLEWLSRRQIDADLKVIRKKSFFDRPKLE